MASFNHWMRFHVGDYLSDTMHLTTLQHGVYLLLIMHYFKHGPIPDDDRALAQIVRLPVNLWNRKKAAVLNKFRLKDGVWTHRRIDVERGNAASLSDETLPGVYREDSKNESHKRKDGTQKTSPDHYRNSCENGGNASVPSRARAAAGARPEPEPEPDSVQEAGETPTPPKKPPKPPTGVGGLVLKFPKRKGRGHDRR